MLRLERHYFTSAGPPPWGPHISLSYSWQLQWRKAAYGVGEWWDGVCFWSCVQGGGSHLKRRREADGRKKLEGVRKEGCGRKKTGGWCLLLCSCGMKMTPSSRRKLSVCRWLILLVGLRRAGGICEKYGSVSVSAGPSDTSRRSAGVTAGLPA